MVTLVCPEGVFGVVDPLTEDPELTVVTADNSSLITTFLFSAMSSFQIYNGIKDAEIERKGFKEIVRIIRGMNLISNL